MKYPDCEYIIEIEPWMADELFDCPHCWAILQLVTDKGGYYNTNDKRFGAL
jgi:hypothetical protein